MKEYIEPQAEVDPFDYWDVVSVSGGVVTPDIGFE
jgi:hypothetical protein